MIRKLDIISSFQPQEPSGVMQSETPYRLDGKYILYVVLFGLGYYLAGEIGLLIDTGYRGVTPLWPASGLAVLVLVLGGLHYWPGIVLGIALLAYRFAMPWDVATMAVMGHVLEALLAWRLIRYFGLKLDFRRVSEVLHFALVAFMAPLASSTLGSLGMLISQIHGWQDFLFVWSLWWLGDAMGILLIVPLVMIWKPILLRKTDINLEDRYQRELLADYQYILQPDRISKFVLYVLVLILVSTYSFIPDVNHGPGRLMLFYLIMPITVLIAVSFEQPGATVASVVISALLLVSYHPGWGSFFVGDDRFTLLTVIAYIGITFITAMVIATLFSERRQSERDLRESHARLKESELRLRQISENINEVFWLADAATGQVIYVSPSYRDVWGYDTESLYRGEPHWLDIVHPEDRQRVRDAHMSFRRTGQYEETYRIRRQDGGERWIHDKGFPVFNEAGQIYRLAGVAEDITAHKIVEEEKQQQFDERARLSRYISVGELGTSLAHEINQPLTSIVCYANGALRRLNENRLSREEMIDVFTRLGNEGERAGRIINKLREFINRKEMKLSSVDLNEILQESIRLVENRLKSGEVRLVYVLAKSLPLVLVDSILTQQVILNLVINAAEAMQEIDRERILTIMTEAGENHVKVCIRDTGPGIPEELREAVFKPLFTTKPSGIGLGLPIAHTIIESMGGDLRAYPLDVRGYAFEFSLPLVDATQKRDQRPRQ